MRDSTPEKAARRWTDLLIESDRRYFAAGANLHRVPGGHLAAIPRLAEFFVGAVVLVDDPGVIVADPRAWRETASAVCGKHGAGWLRFYTAATEPVLSRALAAGGFSSLPEVAMAASAKRVLATGGRVDPSWSIREITTPALWKRKRRLHDVTPDRPDGKPVDAASWARLERGKVRAGYMSAWLIECDGEACGGFGLSFMPTPRGKLLRFKNLFVVPDHRSHGAASAAVRLIAREAIARGYDTFGCFALPGGRGERLYERSGFAKVGYQIEWTAPVAATLVRTRARDAVGG